MKWVVILLLSIGIAVSEARAADQWIRLTTPHFELLTTAGEKKGREGIQYFETVRQFFVNVGIASNLPQKRVRIVAFRGEKEFRPYAPNDFVTAFYAGGADNDYIVLSQIGFENYPVAVHEYTHLVQRRRISTELPLWLNEGLAEFFSTLRPDGKKVAVGEMIPGRLYELHQNRLIDLDTLFAVGHDSSLYNERSRAGLFYSESWALVHMLYASTAYNPHFQVFMNAIESGQSSPAALRTAFGKSVAEVQKDLSGYLAMGDRHHLTAPVQLDKSAEDPDVQPVAAYDADLALAEIMGSSLRLVPTAKTMLSRMMTEQPQRPEASAILAEVALREGRRDDAVRLFAKAAELGSINAEMYFRYAMLMWSRGNGNDDAIRKALEKALQLKPDYVEARMRLGFALMDHSEYKEALAQLKQVKGVMAQDAFTYFRGLAYVNYRLGDTDSARAALERAKQWAREPADRMAVEQLGHSIETSVESGVTPTEAQTETVETVQAPARLPKMEGTMDNLECSSTSARLAILSGGKPVWFLIQDPAAVRMTNAGGVSMDFTCGKQAARTVVIEYQPRVDSETKTVGVVRGIEFK